MRYCTIYCQCRIMNKMKKIRFFLDQLVNVSVILCVIGMIIVIFMQVIFRFIFNNPLSWSEELARYLFVWITFLGASICARERGHIGMDFVVSKFPDKWQSIVEHIGLLLMIVTSITIAITSMETVISNFGQTSPALRLNMGFIYSAIPIGFIYTAVYYAEHFFNLISPVKEIERCE
ncbi:MAG: TRAP transporter small permease [Firmicutes bacterium HGW-Firmicutes-5]|nr:MAG: TRAP transporter small permease [Firmicutes bacterium HGW-Firmicutes-5]